MTARPTSPVPGARQPGEDSDSFAVFIIYRDQRLGGRSLRAVGQTSGQGWAHMEYCCKGWRWVERVTASKQMRNEDSVPWRILGEMTREGESSAGRRLRDLLSAVPDATPWRLPPTHPRWRPSGGADPAMGSTR